MKALTFLFISVIMLIVLLVPGVAIAQDPLSPVCQQASSADVCSTANDVKITGTGGVIIKVARLFALVTGIASVIMIMIGGLKYITSTGDSARVNSAKNTIMYALIGLIIAVTAPFILAIVINKI